ncbi:MAG: tetratricopeptide repeat protein [Pseudomonadota bacterium]
MFKYLWIPILIVFAATAAHAEEPDPISVGTDALKDRRFTVAAANFKSAYTNGDPEGLFYIGRMQELGLGTQANLAKAVIVYQNAQKEGSLRAANRLGLLHLDGKGVLQDFEAARNLICAAADSGLANAQFNCGVLMAQGRGGDQNLEGAVGFYAKAASQAHLGAMNLYGLALLRGNGTEADPAAARSWLEKTAAQGNSLGLFTLGEIYENGLGIEADLRQAHVYYNLAGARGHPQAIQARQRTERGMSETDIEAAQTEARNWSPTPADEN